MSNNVSELHKFLYGEENYQPTDNVVAVENYVAGYTGVTSGSDGYNPIESGKTTSNEETTATVDNTDYDYDDKGQSDFY